MSNHSSQGPFDNGPLDDGPMREAMKKIFGEYPEGKLNAQDEGALAMQIGADQGKVIIQFPKPIHWIGFTPEQAVQMAQSLIEQARKAGFKSPFTIRL